MTRWPPDLRFAIPRIAIVASALLLVGMPTDNGRPVARITATIADPVQTMQDYIADTRKAGISPFIPRRLASNTGRVVSFEITGLSNLAGQRCELRWAELDATDQRPATGSAWQYDDVLAWPDGLFFPDEATERLAGQIWVPEPVATGDYLVRLRFLCDEEEVAQGDTGRFSVKLSLSLQETPVTVLRSRGDHQPAPSLVSALGEPGGATPR